MKEESQNKNGQYDISEHIVNEFVISSKVCSHCRQEKSLSEFRKGSGKGNCKNYCKPCDDMKSHQNYEKNKAKRKSQIKFWQDKNRQKLNDAIKMEEDKQKQKGGFDL